MLNRVDHETHVDSKLVRKRTQAQARSNEQRERIAATSLAASLANGAPPAPPAQPNRAGYASQPSSQQQYQQYPSQQQQHQNLSLSQQSYQQQRPGSAASGDGGKLRRQNTMNQVQAAAGIGPNRMTPLATSGGPPRRLIPQNSAGGRQGVQLTDNGPRPPSGQAALPKRPTQQQQQQMQRPQEIPISNPNKPSTFAEMGITTQKAKKDECTVGFYFSSLLLSHRLIICIYS